MERPRWRATALALATAVLLGISSSDANALALGRITVQSALGEPLRAEIEIPEIDADEIASLRANVAAPDAFKAAGFEYSAALTGIRITLEKRADGRYFLRLTSQRPINEPFIDLILDTSWTSGRIVRDYTLLFDPPSLRQGQPIAAEVTPAGRAAAPAAGSTSTQRTAAAAEKPRAPAAEGGKQVTVKPGDTAGKIAAANKPADVSLDQMLVALLRGNADAFTAGNVNRLRSGAVLQMPSSEEAALVPNEEAKQVLVAQSRDFNEFRRRLAGGLPTTKLTPADRQASGKITAQVQEKRPAAAAPDKLTLSKGSAQAKGGAIAAEEKIARDRAAKDTAARVAELSKNIADLDKLGKGSAAPSGSANVAKGGVPVPVGAPSVAPAASAAKSPAPVMPAAAASAVKSPAAPATVAPAAPVAAASAPAAKPASAVLPAPAVAAAPAAVAASAAAPAPAAAPTLAPASAPAPAAVAAASAAVPTVAPPAVSAASAPSSEAPAKPPVVAKLAAKRPPPPPPEPSLIDELLDNWLVPIGGVLGLLAVGGVGFGVYRAKQRKKSAAVDSSFLESRLQPDSFFGASGGQRIDTNEGGVSGSSLVYSPSQLDAAGDVDPVAEADVYLAYGRDLQAEEILKEAMRTQPQRVAIHAKLLEIYAKRRDARAFELVATEAYGLTHGAGTEWERICELGQELDPINSLYRPGGEPGAVAAPVATAVAASAMKTQPMTATPAVQAPVEAAADIDLDLDFSLGDDMPAEPPAPEVAVNERTQPMAAQPAAAPAIEPMPSLDMDFGATQKTSARPAVAEQTVRLEAPDLALDENALNFDLGTPQAPAAAAAPAPAAPAPAADNGMLEFDLGGLSLDIGAPAKAAAPVPALPEIADAPASTAGAPLSTGGFDDTGGDPLSTKLALAKEFHSIGDPDGARSLAQEVLAEASGELKSAAQKLLAEIG